MNKPFFSNGVFRVFEEVLFNEGVYCIDNNGGFSSYVVFKDGELKIIYINNIQVVYEKKIDMLEFIDMQFTPRDDNSFMSFNLVYKDDPRGSSVTELIHSKKCTGFVVSDDNCAIEIPYWIVCRESKLYLYDELLSNYLNFRDNLKCYNNGGFKLNIRDYINDVGMSPVLKNWIFNPALMNDINYINDIVIRLELLVELKELILSYVEEEDCVNLKSFMRIVRKENSKSLI